MKTNTGILHSGYRKGLSSVLLLMMLPAGASVQTKPVQNELQASQGQAQMAQARELLGHDSIHLVSAAARKIDEVNSFVRAYTERSLRNSGPLQAANAAATIIEESRRYGFDPLLLLAVIENESRFSPDVIGTHGEIGLMQIKPDTAEWIAKKAHIQWAGAKSLHNPSINIQLGAAYLSMLRTEFRANKDLYLGAYNMGSRNVRRMLSVRSSPQVYAQKTIKHYSRIYIEFMAEGEKSALVQRSYASI